MFSRRNTRIALIQSLYADIFVSHLDIAMFRETYKDENRLSRIDEVFFWLIRSYIHQNSFQLLSIIQALAPKFELEKMPRLHIIILFVAFAEIFSIDEIDEKVSINEAIELAKIFSDESGARFINGILGTFIRNRENYIHQSPSTYQFFN